MPPKINTALKYMLQLLASSCLLVIIPVLHRPVFLSRGTHNHKLVALQQALLYYGWALEVLWNYKYFQINLLVATEQHPRFTSFVFPLPALQFILDSTEILLHQRNTQNQLLLPNRQRLKALMLQVHGYAAGRGHGLVPG